MSIISDDRIKEIIQSQKKYFESGETRVVSKRIVTLKTLKKCLLENQNEIFKALKADLGKPDLEIITSELGFVIQDINFMIKHIKKWTKPVKVPTPFLIAPGKSQIFREPYGTVLTIGPWNYPLQLSLLPAIGAIAAGNTVVLKPSEFTVHTATILESIINNNFDEKVFKVLTGGPELAAKLCSQKFNYIFFTGSTKVGRKIRQTAAENLIPMTLELGGKNPCIVHEDCNVKVTARKIIWGKFFNAGQTCIAPNAVFVHKNVKEELIKELVNTIKSFYSDDPQSSPSYGRLVNEDHFNRLIEIMSKAKIYFGGQNDKKTRYISPTILTNDIDPNSLLECDEIFGPLLPIIEYESQDELFLKLLNFKTPLVSYLFTDQKDMIEAVRLRNPSGSIVINECFGQVMNPHLAFGAYGTSGMGSYHGLYTFMTFTRPLSIFKRPRTLEVKFRYPPYTQKTVEFMKKSLFK